MAKPYSDDLRSRVAAAIASGESCRLIGDRFEIAPSTYQTCAFDVGGNHLSQMPQIRPIARASPQASRKAPPNAVGIRHNRQRMGLRW